MGTLQVPLNFVVKKTEDGAFEFPYVTTVPEGESLYLKPSTVTIQDLRTSERHPSMDVEGYTWQSVPYEGLDGEAGWEEEYAKKTCE